MDFFNNPLKFYKESSTSPGGFSGW